MHGFTPKLLNCQYTATAAVGKYIKIGNILVGTIAVRGAITAVTGDKYSTIDISEIEEVDRYESWNGFCVSQECNCTTNNASVMAWRGSERYIGYQRSSDGIVSDTWKITNPLYIKIGFIAMK